MVNFFIVAIYLCLLSISVAALKSTKGRSLGFAEGSLIGALFFLAAPLGISLVTGVIKTQFVAVRDFFPYQDLLGTVNLFLGWAVVIAVWAFERLSFARRRFRDAPAGLLRGRGRQRDFLIILLFLYFGFSLYTLSNSSFGKVGAKWNDLQGAGGGNVLLGIIMSFSSGFRMLAYGALLASVEGKAVSRWTAVMLGATVAIFDVATSFNRVGIAYYALMVFLIFRKNWKLILLVAALSLAPVRYVSNVWTAFRATVFSQKLSLTNIGYAWQHATDIALTIESRQQGETFEAIFESSNVAVFNFILDEFGEKYPYFWGYTFILRPLTTFVPASVWEDKPKVFATYIGEYGNHMEMAINSTLFGEPYGNFGPLWLFALMVYLVAFSRIYRGLERYAPGSATMGCFVGFAVWRFEANFASVCLYCVLLIFLVSVPVGWVRRLSRPVTCPPEV